MAWYITHISSMWSTLHSNYQCPNGRAPGSPNSIELNDIVTGTTYEFVPNRLSRAYVQLPIRHDRSRVSGTTCLEPRYDLSKLVRPVSGATWLRCELSRHLSWVSAETSWRKAQCIFALLCTAKNIISKHRNILKSTT